jgi:uncharacterized iron-regulated protein
MTSTRLFRIFCRPVALLLALCLASIDAVPAKTALEATPEALAGAMSTRRNALLGEVHDNGVQHALRAAALRRLVEAGARPAIAFEQFDREHQADIDRLRREQPGDVDALIALGAPNWQWKHYRPFLQLAVDNGLPIVAANLSRADAVKVTMQGWGAVFDTAAQADLGLDRLPPDFVAAHEDAVARGHCDLLPRDSLPAMARAQMARDIVLTHSLRPHLVHGVVLLTGNGHVRKDIGVPFWLNADERRDVVAIGLLELDPTISETTSEALSQHYDAIVKTAAAERPDPCEALRKRLQPAAKP